MKILTILITIMLCNDINAQIISQFSWDSNPVTNADVGPNAISSSSSATSDINGVGGTNGLNAGLPKMDIDFVIPTGSGIFDVAGIEVSFDFQRDESFGTFFRRGSSLIINGCANLSVTYRVDDGAGGFNTVSSGNVYGIPNDNTFRNYKFYYLPTTGYGALLVDDVEIWSNDGPDNRNMYWTGAGNIIIGDGMDGSGSNRTFLDNLIIGNVINSPLPIELVNFNAEPINKTVLLKWQTAAEINNDYFTIERSTNAKTWEALSDIKGAGNSSSILNYSIYDYQPYKGVSYYRLKQTDFDGNYTYSDIKSVNFKSLENSDLLIYPNPTKNMVTLSGSALNSNQQIILYNSLGQNVTSNISITTENGNIVLDLSVLSNGLYFIKTQNSTHKVTKQ